MGNKIPPSVAHLFTQRRIFKDDDKTRIKDFRPLIQGVNREEILYIKDIVASRYGQTFTIDLIKRIPEERFIYFRGTFNFEGYEGKGTVYLNDDTFEIIFDNLERILKMKEEKIMTEFIKE